MSALTRTNILSLYRSFLRVIERWPTDYLRPNRNLKHILHLRVTEGFRQNNAVKDADVLRALVLDAEIELDALRRLAENEFKEKVNYKFQSYTHFRIGFIDQQLIQNIIQDL
ncbi:23026_t:CDS:2 [Racocetra persica]|uniref:23026_t:CDS:1 n=1 Tax=Racocetra persica TaxID=160502 RepID=A0ACA9LWU2_9GLOM|nr:23026_t:CDS:2 [Racocetra persica]